MQHPLTAASENQIHSITAQEMLKQRFRDLDFPLDTGLQNSMDETSNPKVNPKIKLEKQWVMGWKTNSVSQLE